MWYSLLAFQTLLMYGHFPMPLSILAWGIWDLILIYLIILSLWAKATVFQQNIDPVSPQCLKRHYSSLSHVLPYLIFSPSFFLHWTLENNSKCARFRTSYSKAGLCGEKHVVSPALPSVLYEVGNISCLCHMMVSVQMQWDGACKIALQITNWKIGFCCCWCSTLFFQTKNINFLFFWIFFSSNKSLHSVRRYWRSIIYCLITRRIC